MPSQNYVHLPTIHNDYRYFIPLTSWCSLLSAPVQTIVRWLNYNNINQQIAMHSNIVITLLIDDYIEMAGHWS